MTLHFWLPFALSAAVICPALADEPPDCSYPSSERKLGIEGVVALDVTVGTDGSVKDDRVIKSSGNANLDRVAEVCAKKFRYKPAMQNGVPVEAHTQAKIVWKLH